MSQFASPEDLEKHHVRDVYDKIAPHFVGSRHKAWPRVEEFLLSLPLGSLIADVGCGSGKYLGLAPESFVIGSDSCTEFGEIAAKRGHNIVACDNQDLSFRDSCFDAVISVGVIHHFASVKRRTKALEELYRILRPGGRMLVYVWAFEQDERKFDGQDVLVPYTHYQRNKVLARRSMSTPERPRHHSQSHRGAPNVSAASWRARRAYSFDDSRYDHAHNQKHKERADRTRHRNHDSSVEKVHSTAPSKYTILESIRNQGTAAPSRLEAEDTPVKKLSKFINSFIKKIFDDDESHKLSSDHTQTKEQAKDVSVDTNTDFSAKFSALMSYFSAENREKYFKAEFLSLMAKRLFPSKDHMHLVHEFGQSSADSEGIRDEFSPRQETEEHTHPVHEFGQSSADSEEIGDEFSPRQETEEHDVIICMKEERGNAHYQVGEGSRKLNGVNLGVMARLVDSLASLSDLDSDSSSSSDYLTSDSSAAEEWDRAESSLAHSKKTFQHTTVRCQEPVEPVCAADSQYSSTSSSFSSSTRSLSSSSSPSPSASSSSSSPVATTSQKKVKSKLFQRYYHVFRAGELVRLAQEGIPSAVVLKEYYDHGNWAVILVKAVGRHGLRHNSEMI